MALVAVPSSNVSMYGKLRHITNPSLGGSNIRMFTIRNNVHGGTYAFSYYRNANFRRVKVYNMWSVVGSTLPVVSPTVKITSPTTATSGSGSGDSILSKSFKSGSYTLTIDCEVPYSNLVNVEFEGWYSAPIQGGTLLATSQTVTFGTTNYNNRYDWYGTVTISEGFCTPAGTKISMHNAPDKNVEDIVVGDVVKSANVPGVPDTNIHDPQVSELFEWDSGVNSADEWNDWNLTKANVISVEPEETDALVSINDGQLQCTPRHILMMYTERMDGSRGWCLRQARALNEGDHVLQQNGTGILVSKVERIEATEENPITVYKLNVENDDFYWTNGFMSHNMK